MKLISSKMTFVVPLKLPKDVLFAVHDSPVGGHFGIGRTYNVLQKRYYWQGMYADVDNYVKSCEE